MGFTYYIFEISLLLFPILGLIIVKYVPLTVLKSFFKYGFVFILIHNFLYYFGYSVKGDSFDYFIFSFEYLLFLLVVFRCREIKRNIYTQILTIMGYLIMSLAIIIGVIGIGLFIVISQDYESNGKFDFNGNDKLYETRRYSSGFVTSETVKYTFETYRIFKYLPLEKKIDKTIFLDNGTKLYLDQDLIFEIVQENNQEVLIIKSSNGEKFVKQIKRD